MSAFFDSDQHLADIHEAALKLAPMCSSGIDFTSPADSARVASRAWELGSAFVEQYYQKVEDASVRQAEAEARAARSAPKPIKAPKKDEVTHG